MRKTRCKMKEYYKLFTILELESKYIKNNRKSQLKEALKDFPYEISDDFETKNNYVDNPVTITFSKIKLDKLNKRI